MFQEIDNPRQNDGDPFRRVFQGDKLDLVVWYEGEKIIGFQLGMTISGHKSVYTWDHKKGGMTHGVDVGEGYPFKAKQSPVLTEGTTSFGYKLMEVFMEEGESLDNTLGIFIYSKLIKSFQ